MASVIQKLRLISISLSISGVVKTRSNVCYKYEYDCTRYVLYKKQRDFCK